MQCEYSCEEHKGRSLCEDLGGRINVGKCQRNLMAPRQYLHVGRSGELWSSSLSLIAKEALIIVGGRGRELTFPSLTMESGCSNSHVKWCPIPFFATRRSSQYCRPFRGHKNSGSFRTHSSQHKLGCRSNISDARFSYRRVNMCLHIIMGDCMYITTWSDLL